jgi:8-oxo-dGTP pyrophosphatase MutT (NUDIX family)
MPRLLMGRRAKGHSFMPSKWVFPGGRVDRSDFSAPVATKLGAEVEARLQLQARHTSPKLPRALAMAAVRETFEEVGLLLRERQGKDFRFDLCCPPPVAWVIGCHTSMSYPRQSG